VRWNVLLPPCMWCWIQLFCLYDMTGVLYALLASLNNAWAYLYTLASTHVRRSAMPSRRTAAVLLTIPGRVTLLGTGRQYGSKRRLPALRTFQHLQRVAGRIVCGRKDVGPLLVSSRMWHWLDGGGSAPVDVWCSSGLWFWLRRCCRLCQFNAYHAALPRIHRALQRPFALRAPPPSLSTLPLAAHRAGARL